MTTLYVLRRVSVESMALLLTCVAAAQIPPSDSSTNSSNPPAPVACQNGLTLKSLEENPDVLKAASVHLAAQMIERYKADSTKRPNLGEGTWGDFHATMLAVMISCAETKTASAQAKTARTNTQIGAPPSSDGSTSAVQKVGIPTLLGVAVEDGAVTNSVTGTAMTLSTTPYGFFAAFGKDEDTQAEYNRFHFFTQFGISATFNVATTTNSLASATRKQVSQWQTKITFRDTSTRSSKVNDLYQQGGLGAAGTKLAADLSNSQLIGPEHELEKAAEAVYEREWSKSLKSLISQVPDAATDQQREGIGKALLSLLDKDVNYQDALSNALDDLKLDSSKGLRALLNRIGMDRADYAEKESEFEKNVKDLTKGWNGDLAFGQKYPTSTSTTSAATPSTSSTKPPTPVYLFGELDVTCEPKTDKTQKGPCPLGSQSTLTGNFSGSFYTNPNPALNETTFRGGTGALQAQWNLGPGFVKTKSANDKSQMTLSASGSYQRLQENKDQKGKRPDIVLGNLKLEIPISSGVSFPLSFSVANAAEQIKETYVKGNFGVSFDLDKLASLLKANQ